FTDAVLGFIGLSLSIFGLPLSIFGLPPHLVVAAGRGGGQPLAFLRIVGEVGLGAHKRMSVLSSYHGTQLRPIPPFFFRDQPARWKRLRWRALWRSIPERIM